MIEVEGSAREVRRKFRLAAAATILSVVWGGLSYLVAIGDNPGAWFARSGAVITVLALFNESQLSEGIGRLKGRMKKICLRRFDIWRAVNLVSAAVGTIIWGYGDLLF